MSRLLCRADRHGQLCTAVGTVTNGATSSSSPKAIPCCCIALNTPAETFRSAALALIPRPDAGIMSSLESGISLALQIQITRLKGATGKAGTVVQCMPHDALVWGGHAHADESLRRPLSQALSAL